MYQAKTGQKPPAAMAAAMAKFDEAQTEQLARGVANFGTMPRNLSRNQREAVTAKLRRVNPSI